jgi:hypothetical protein
MPEQTGTGTATVGMQPAVLDFLQPDGSEALPMMKKLVNICF